MKRLFATSGFTLIETLVAISIFIIITTISSSAIISSLSSSRKALAQKDLFDEARIALERVVKELRAGTIDYEEYFNWSYCNETSCDTGASAGTPDTHYGQNYGSYGARFYRPFLGGGDAPETATEVTLDYEQIGEFNEEDAFALSYGHPNCTSDAPHYAAADDPDGRQCELYIISADGATKTIIRLEPQFTTAGETLSYTNPENGNEEPIYHLAMLQLNGTDAFGEDGQIDTFTVHPAFVDEDGNPVFHSLHSDNVSITRASFFVAPLHDPRKAFADFSSGMQTQPRVLISLSAQAVSPVARTLHASSGTPVTVDIQTLISARAQNEIVSVKPFSTLN